MYLRIFEDMSMSQTESEPDINDLDAIESKILNVIIFEDGKFVAINSEGAKEEICNLDLQ